MKRARIAVVGDFDADKIAHRAIEACFCLAQDSALLPVERVWVATQSIVPGDESALRSFQGLWSAPGSPSGRPGETGPAPGRSGAPTGSRRAPFRTMSRSRGVREEAQDPRRSTKEGVASQRISLPPYHGDPINKSSLLARPRPTGLPPSSAPHSPTLRSRQLVPWAR
jgi:hypothetical protein